MIVQAKQHPRSRLSLWRWCQPFKPCWQLVCFRQVRRTSFLASDNHGASCIDGARGRLRDQETILEIKRYVRHWIGIGPRPMPAISKRSTPSIARMRYWNTRSQASESAVDATYRSHALSSQVKSVSLCGESLAAVIFGSPNTF